MKQLIRKKVDVNGMENSLLDMIDVLNEYMLQKDKNKNFKIVVLLYAIFIVFGRNNI